MKWQHWLFCGLLMVLSFVAGKWMGDQRVVLDNLYVPANGAHAAIIEIDNPPDKPPFTQRNGMSLMVTLGKGPATRGYYCNLKRAGQ